MWRNYSAYFKVWIALEAIKREKPFSKLSSLYEVHPNQIRVWKTKLLAGKTASFQTNTI